MKNKLAKDMEDSIQERQVELEKEDRVDFISTGCIPLNLALSQRGRNGGIARGRICNLVGDGSSGKCIKNAYILTSNGMELIDTIGKNKEIGLSEYKEVLSTSKEKLDNTSHFWKEKVSETNTIISRHGYELEGTNDHKIMVFEEFQFKMKKLEDLKVGDIVIISRGTNYFPKNNFKIPIREIEHESPSTKIATLPEYLDEDLARLLGYIVADGNIVSNGIVISNTKNYIRNDISYISNKIGLSFSKNGIFSVYLVDIIKKLLSLSDNDIFTAHYKYVPDCILKSTKKIQSNFLKALIDCDGWGNKNSIHYYTASEKLAKQVQLMLLNFGIITNLSFKENVNDGIKIHNHKYYTVSIYGEDLKIYMNEVGSLKYNPGTTNGRKSGYDNIPFLVEKMKSDIQELKNKIGWSRNGRCKTKNKIFPKFKLSNFYNGSNLLVKRFIDNFEGWDVNLSLYKDILKYNYHFDPIKLIKKNRYETIVYDVHIPKSHLFWSNGFISHNTLLALETAAWLFYNHKNLKSSIYPDVKKLDIIYNNSEGVMDFPIERMYGEDFVNAVQWTQISSVQKFGRDVQRRTSSLKEGHCLLYIQDSIESLLPDEAKERIDKSLKNDKSEENSYGTEKAKYFSSSFFNDLCERQKGKDSTLLFISQVRENLNAGMFGKKFYRTGGKALDFYTHQVMWLYQKEKLKKTHKSQERIYGIRGLAKIERNKTALPYREAEFSILFNYGIDNIQSCADYLFGPKDKEIEWNNQQMKKSELIDLAYENEDVKNELIIETEKLWQEIEEKINIHRPSKY